jgi:hypothetical protein
MAMLSVLISNLRKFEPDKELVSEVSSPRFAKPTTTRLMCRPTNIRMGTTLQRGLPARTSLFLKRMELELFAIEPGESHPFYGLKGAINGHVGRITRRCRLTEY